ncbi:MAG: mechanosensitive ion channel family protein [Thermoguttaceae bacterium]|jgi:small-conductance mechanosensitive channel
MEKLMQFVKAQVLDPSAFLGAIFYAAVFIAAAWASGWLLKSSVTRAMERDHRGLVDRTAAPFVVQLLRVLMYVIALLIYVHLVPELRGIGTALLAGAGVASIVLGLAAQNTLGNLIAGMTLLLYRPFQVGDRVQVTAPTGLETGVVEVITLGYTILRTGDNRRIVVPNSAMANQVTVNLTSVDPRIVVDVPIRVGYAADLEKARKILVQLAQQHPHVREVAGCPLTALGESSVTLTLQVRCADAGVAKQVEFDLLEQAKKRFQDEDVEIPFPYYNLVFKNMPPST